MRCVLQSWRLHGSRLFFQIIFVFILLYVKIIYLIALLKQVFNLDTRLRLVMEWSDSFPPGGILCWLGRKCIQVELGRCNENSCRRWCLISHCWQWASRDHHQMLVHIHSNGKLPSRDSGVSAEPWMVEGHRYCAERTKMILEQIYNYL